MATTIRSNENVTIYRAKKLDVNGNPRYIVHFRDFLTEEEWSKLEVLEGYELAAKKIKKNGGGWRSYNCKEFGGGFITQGDYCNGRETEKEVLKIRAIKI